MSSKHIADSQPLYSCSWQS